MFRFFSASLLAVAFSAAAAEPARGVLEAKADLATKSAEAKYDPDKVSPEALAKAVTNAGYPAIVKKP